jgi:hypothetical protein
MNTFRIAPMCMTFRVITLVLLALPLLFVLGAGSSRTLLNSTALFLVVIYSWVWLRFRPTRFVVHQDRLEVIWPLKRRQIRRDSISAMRVINRRDLRSEVGWGMRVGAGGLWGGFGWLWTQKRGIVQMYISRMDGLVWIERETGRPWLISPERPEEFVQTLACPNA